MAKKPKLNFGEAGGHNFFAKHVEKLILGAVALLVAFFVYSGLKVEGIDSSKNPVHLRNQANNARSNIEKTTWEAVKDEDDRHAYELTQRLSARGKDLQLVDHTAYANILDWNAQPFRLKGKRADPPWLPPRELEVTPGYGPIAMVGSLTNDQLMKAAQDAALAKLEEEKKNARRRRDDSNPMYPGAEGAPYGPSGRGAEVAGSYRVPPGESGGAYGSSTSSGPVATPEQLANVPGYRPGAGGSSGYGVGASPYGASGYASVAGAEGYGAAAGATGTLAVGKYFMAVKALVPYKEQWTEFERTFEDAHDYNPVRDIPQYYYYQVERVEVDEAGQVIPGKEKTWTPETTAWYQRNWYAGTPEFVVDPAYFDRLLTCPAPPLMMRDLDRFRLHSKTPKRQIVPLARAPMPSPTDIAPPAASGEGAGPQARPLGPGGVAGGPGGYPGAAPGYGASPYGAMASTQPGYNAMYGQQGATTEGGYGASSRYGGTDPYGGQTAYEPYGAVGGGYGSQYGSAPGAASYGPGAQGLAAKPPGPTVDYKLFRFFDFDITPGKKYKYRVKLFLLDPNHPADPREAPPIAYLEEKVIERVRKVDAEDARKSQSTGQPTRTFWVETEWSEWSEVASIPPQHEILAGAVTPEKSSVVDRERGIEVQEPGSEPEAKVLAMVWDHAKAADIPGEQTAVRGSVLNFTGPANILHPVSLQVVSLPEYKFRTDTLVLDLRGGGSLPTVDRANADQKAPGEILMRDALGNLVVRNELDDLFDYNNNVFKEPEKPKLLAEGSDPMYPGATGYPPGEGGVQPGYGPGPQGGRTGRTNRRGNRGAGGGHDQGP